jgi:hypothetical protein
MLFLEGDYDTKGAFDIRDLLTEIRHLRVQLDIHILSYYKLFLNFNLCLSVMLDRLSS